MNKQDIFDTGLTSVTCITAIVSFFYRELSPIVSFLFLLVAVTRFDPEFINELWKQTVFVVSTGLVSVNLLSYSFYTSAGYNSVWIDAGVAAFVVIMINYCAFRFNYQSDALDEKHKIAMFAESWLWPAMVVVASITSVSYNATMYGSDVGYPIIISIMAALVSSGMFVVNNYKRMLKAKAA